MTFTSRSYPSPLQFYYLCMGEDSSRERTRSLELYILVILILAMGGMLVSTPNSLLDFPWLKLKPDTCSPLLEEHSATQIPDPPTDCPPCLCNKPTKLRKLPPIGHHSPPEYEQLPRNTDWLGEIYLFKAILPRDKGKELVCRCGC
ncbi:hypothetical protein NEOLI_002032 [Neolecta irregularis DAH-3]|uniref:Uncharacterized protein n=1 Tax=Neolecta irregularis (strain DAH-3) TaxID=1198029 RepID=A0A1U7LJ63_NEOID|nr:hypothetical protein NEOLI_002032 [Neolecta irregularis DAH-3]|eukprot:OLL22592.1 hypothetical protein NEOLI_002032 [Neolecta irregularis DAH-3]